MSNIYLVGFMGTGKTTVGKALSKAISWDFLDLDLVIQKREKKDIPQIFAKKGEPCFRRLEKENLKAISRQKGFVVSCGGGIVIDPANIRLMKKTGIMICLSTNPKIILSRISGLKNRPLLNVSQPLKRIKELLRLRAQFYAKADYTIDTSRVSLDKIVNNIIRVISRGEK